MLLNFRDKPLAKEKKKSWDLSLGPPSQVKSRDNGVTYEKWSLGISQWVHPYCVIIDWKSETIKYDMRAFTSTKKSLH